jgi:ribonucleoside-diphosphate reductase beta chain
MSYAQANKGLKIISSLQQTTAVEEMVHYSFGIDLINIIKEEYPQLWSDYLVELVEKNIQMAYDSELKLIDWFFAKGVPSHLTKEEVVNFLNYNFNVINKDLKLDLKFTVDENMYYEKNIWMIEKISTVTEPDFFDAPPSGYSSVEQEIDFDNFEL